MYEVKILTHFAAAHGLINYHGKCENLHGHNWKVEVTVRGPKVDKAGMLLDFAELKRATNRVMDQIDHTHLNELEAFKGLSPSSENIARFIYDQVSAEIDSDRGRVIRVDTWESDTSRASYVVDDA